MASPSPQPTSFSCLLHQQRAVSRTTQGSHASAWQGRVHVWVPQAKVRLQTVLQLSSVSPHLSASTAPFGHPHLTSVVMRHGGQGPGWQRGRQGCAHAGRARAHREAQECREDMREGGGDGDAAGLAAGAAPLATFLGLVRAWGTSSGTVARCSYKSNTLSSVAWYLRARRWRPRGRTSRLGVHTALLGMGVRELGKVDVYAVPAPVPAPAAVNAPQKLSMHRRSLRAPSASLHTVTGLP
ncbi:hypothetical protein B0H14DRAFT_3518371 [Mycena olivaceomarginata]|nr:hypothetical protein B0H14DRAFT_3518371 [Mycena olivaceomarginata]